MTTPSTASKPSLAGLAVGPVKLDLARVAFWSITAVIIAGMIQMHFVAGMTLPAPWGDEAFFMWQARAFERWNNFAAPELDASRPILLLPYIYQLILGLVFKIFGYSFELARGMSLVFTIAGFALMAASARLRSAQIAGLILIGAFMMDGKFIVVANNARMEALLFATICGAILLLQRGRVWTSLAVLAVAPMIHPNGVLFLFPVAIYAVVAHKIHRVRIPRAALIVFCIALVAWLANGLYALSYWDGLRHDIAYRLAETTKASSGWSQFGGWYAVALGLIVATGVLAARLKVRVGYLLIFAVGAWLMWRVRIEQWYEVFGSLTYLLTSLALLEIAVQVLPSIKTRLGSAPRWTVASVALATLLVANLFGGQIPGPKGYIEDLKVDGMVVAGDVKYLTQEDREALNAYLRDSAAKGARTVEIYPWGDTLLMTDLGDLKLQIPYFDPIFVAGGDAWRWGFGPTEGPTADVYVMHATRYQPRWQDERFNRVFGRAEARAGKKLEVLHSRDGTETWYVVRSLAE